jgi:serine/threonine-protein kinase RsbT
MPGHRAVELRSSGDLLHARLAAREMAQAAGLGVMDQTRFATAVSELARNALVYAAGGTCALQDLSDASHVRLQAEVSDDGPGIADIAQAMGDGYSSGGSLGAGLPGTRRLVDQFHIESDNSGTVVRVQVVRRRRG